MPKSEETSTKASKKPPSSPPEDLSSGSGNALESMRRNATETPSFAGLAADANSMPGHVSSKRSPESELELDKSADFELTDDEVSVNNNANRMSLDFRLHKLDLRSLPRPHRGSRGLPRWLRGCRSLKRPRLPRSPPKRRRVPRSLPKPLRIPNNAGVSFYFLIVYVRF